MGSRREYPRLDSVRDMRKKWLGNSHLCCVCGAPATAKTTVQVNWFRGDDEDFKTCWDHRQDVAAICASETAKARFAA